jgi:Flp pilus assembly protein TadG
MKRRRTRGQAMVEFALVAPVFFLLVFSVIQFGIMFGGQNGLVAATREFARYAAPYRVKTSTDATNVCNDTRLGTQLTTFLKRSIPGYGSTNVEQRQVVYSWQANPDGTYYVQLQIKVSYHFPLYVPLVGGIIDGFDANPWKSDGRFMLDATEQMRVENEDLTASYLSSTGTNVANTVTCTI